MSSASATVVTSTRLAAAVVRRLGRIEGIKVAICGDIRHSRVANSNLRALPLLGAKVRIVAPESLMPAALPPDIAAFTDLDEGIAGADVVMTLRIQHERLEEAYPDTLVDYHRDFGVTRARLDAAAPGAVVMHPGPMNRGVEIDPRVADAPEALIEAQVRSGLVVRMAVLYDLLTTGPVPVEVTVATNENTQVVQGGTPITLADLKPGQIVEVVLGDNNVAKKIAVAKPKP